MDKAAETGSELSSAPKSLSDADSADGLPDASALVDSDFSSDPFADIFYQSTPEALLADDSEVVPFFMGGDRRSVLDEVIHLCEFSNNIVAVLGEAGVGKTMLAYQAALELQSMAESCFISASVMTSEDDILYKVAQQLGVFVSTEEHDGLQQAIAEYKPVGSHDDIVIIVDDAHHLGHSVLSALVDLLQNQKAQCFHVLLIGDSSLLLRLDEMDKGEVMVYDIPLCPFKLDELQQYLEFKLSVVGYQGAELFSYSTIENLWNDTRGIPASVNHTARQLLPGGISDDDHKKLGMPLGYMAVLVVLLAALIMAVFYVGDEVSPEKNSDALPLASELETAVATEESQVNRVAEPSSESGLQVDEALRAENVGLDSVVAEEGGDTPGTEISDEADSAVKKEPAEQAVAGALPDAQNKLEQPVTETVTAEVEPKIPAPEPKIESQPVAEQPAELISDSNDKSTSIVLTGDEQAVMLWPSEKYTLQIIGAGQFSGVQKFVESQPNKNLLRIVGFERQGEPWYVVLTGVYNSVAEARASVATLPEPQRRTKPWPRKISDVQSNIEQFRRK